MSEKKKDFKERVIDWAIGMSKHGDSWWLPFALIGVSAFNSLTGGVFVWCVGVMQAVLLTLVGMSHGKVGVVLAPLCVTIGASVAAVSYIKAMQAGGSDALLSTVGLKDSKVLDTAQAWAKDYGAFGLIFIQVCPFTPVPTAVLVVAGMLAKMNEYKVFVVLMVGKFLTLLLNSCVIFYVSQGKTVEECLEMHLRGGLAEALAGTLKEGEESKDGKQGKKDK